MAGALYFEPLGISFEVSQRALLALTYIILFPMIYCHWAYFSLVRIFPASIAAIGTLAIPVVGVFSSFLILNEPVGLTEIAALILVVTALTLAIVVKRPG